MLPFKLMRSLVSGDNSIISNNPLFTTQNHNFSSHGNADENEEDDESNPFTISSRNRIPLLIFTPTQELVKDTYRLASICRAIGMDLQPNPSLSHVIFSWPSSSASTSSSSSVSMSSSSVVSSSSPTYSWSLPDDSVPLPFPSFETASLSHLRLFVNLSKGYFKLAFLKNNRIPAEKIESLSNKNWHCSSLSLFCTRTVERIESMDGFSRALLGVGWTLFRTNNGCTKGSVRNVLYLYRRLNPSGVCSTKDTSKSCSRVRELRLPPLDFSNVPLRILQYILLMTDDVFYLA